MASEGQLVGLRNWLKQEIPAGKDVCEMPSEVCSDALSRLHEASEKYKEDKKKNYGLVLKTKKEIVKELREQGWIDVQSGVNKTIEAEQKAPVEPKLPKKPNGKEVFGARAEAEAQRIREEQGLTPTSEQEMITIALTQELPAFMGTDGKIYDLKTGVNAEIPKENAEGLLNRGLATMEGEEPPQQPAVTELIMKFVNIRAEVSEMIRNDERIPEREKGYAENWVSDKVADAMEKEGGDQE